MTIHRTILAAAFALAFVGAAQADGLRPSRAAASTSARCPGSPTTPSSPMASGSSPPSRRARPARPCVLRPSSPRARASCSPPRARRVSHPTRSRSAGRTIRCWFTRRQLPTEPDGQCLRRQANERRHRRLDPSYYATPAILVKQGRHIASSARKRRIKAPHVCSADKWAGSA